MKKIIIITLGCVVGVILIWLGVQVHLFYNPVITIKRSVANSEDFYSEVPLIFIEKESVFGTCQKVKENVSEFTEKNADFSRLRSAEYTKPMNITCHIKIVDGKTIVTYQGTASNFEGEKSGIYETFVFDFIISKKIE